MVLKVSNWLFRSQNHRLCQISVATGRKSHPLKKFSVYLNTEEIKGFGISMYELFTSLENQDFILVLKYFFPSLIYLCSSGVKLNEVE